MQYLNQNLDPQLNVSYLSGGQRQLVAIGRSISFDPAVLILDEPTSALSVAGTELVHETILELQQDGLTQILVNHNVADVLSLADRIGVMYQGSLIEVIEAEHVNQTELSNLIRRGNR